MALVDHMATLFMKRLGSDPILGVQVDPKILHRGTAKVTGRPTIYLKAPSQGVVTLVTPSHLLLIDSGRPLVSVPWNIVTSFSKIENIEMLWLLEVEFPTYGPGAISLQPRNIKEIDLFLEFVTAINRQLESS